MPNAIEFKTRFIIRDESGLIVSGSPGIALEYISFATHLSIDDALALYRAATSIDSRISISPYATIEELHTAALDSLMPSVEIFHRNKLPLFLMSAREYARVEISNLLIGDVYEAFTEPKPNYACIQLNNLASEVLQDADDKGITYFIRSNEQGSHHKPHVHVDYNHERGGVIEIGTGKVLSGNLPERVALRASKRIVENSPRLLDYWNHHTNGIHFDSNVYLGQTPVINL